MVVGVGALIQTPRDEGSQHSTRAARGVQTPGGPGHSLDLLWTIGPSRCCEAAQAHSADSCEGLGKPQFAAGRPALLTRASRNPVIPIAHLAAEKWKSIVMTLLDDEDNNARR
jgi:hypothetical protein